MNRLKSAYFIQPPAQFGRNLELTKAQVVFELYDFRSTHDRRSDARLSDHPIQRNLRRRLIDLSRHIKERIENTPIVLGESLETRIGNTPGDFQTALSLSGISFSLVLAAKKTTGERTPGCDT